MATRSPGRTARPEARHQTAALNLRSAKGLDARTLRGLHALQLRTATRPCNHPHQAGFHPRAALTITYHDPQPTSKETMKIQIELPDKTYNKLLAEERRLRGSLGIVNKGLLSFNPYSCTCPKDGRKAFRRLPHGKAAVYGNKIHLHLVIDAEETRIAPAEAIIVAHSSNDCFKIAGI